MTTPAQATAHEQITTAKRRLGERFRAWRMRAGLTQAELAARTGCKRAAIRNAEGGTSRSRPLFTAADHATGAGGALLAERDHTDTAIAAIRQQAIRQARTAQARAIVATSPSPPATTQPATCPHCHHVSILTLTALPPTSHPTPHTSP
jgi:transcriptional regulator with XRE-family HTH domain